MFRFFQLIVAAATLLLSQTLSADSVPPCYREIQTTFFQQQLVAEALSLYRVNQTLWHPIYNDLQRASYLVPAIIQARARSMSPNPLYPVFIPEKAFELLQHTLEGVYTEVLMRYRTSNLTINSTTTKGGFGYIWDKQFHRISSCAVPPR